MEGYESYDAIDLEVETLRGRLVTERQALAKLRVRYDAACILVVNDQEAEAEATILAGAIAVAETRVHGFELVISGKEKVLKELQPLRDKAMAVEFAKKAETELEEKRERLTEAVRVARLRMDEAKAARPDAIALADRAQAAYTKAEGELSRHQRREIDPLMTSPEEKRKHEQRGVRLEAARVAALKACNEALNASTAAQNAYLAAVGEFGHACDILRWNVPPKPEDRPRLDPAMQFGSSISPIN